MITGRDFVVATVAPPTKMTDAAEETPAVRPRRRPVAAVAGCGTGGGCGDAGAGGARHRQAAGRGGGRLGKGQAGLISAAGRRAAWVGLGNPEPGMARNRHNIGFMAVDVIATRHGFGPWRQRFKGLVAEGMVGQHKVLALKPQTYMNVSGESVQAAAAFYKLAPEAITAFHDELDLVPGKVRVKRGGGAAGHNGPCKHGPACSARRITGGCGWGSAAGPGEKGSACWVMCSAISAGDDRDWLVRLLDAVADAAELLADGKPEEFMTKVALLARPNALPGEGTA